MAESQVAQAATDPLFGIAPRTVEKLLRVFDTTPGVDAVWIFGSRARGTERPASDIDLAVDASSMDAARFAALRCRIEDLELLYRTDVLWLQELRDQGLRDAILRDRRLFWSPKSR